MAEAVAAGRAGPAAQLRERPRLRRGQRRVPRRRGPRAGLRRPPLGRLPPDPGGRRPRPEGGEGDADLLRRVAQPADGPRRGRPAGARRGRQAAPGVGRAGPAPRQAAARLQRRADRGAPAPLARRRGAGVGGARARRGGAAQQRHADRPRGRRPSVLPLGGRPDRAPGAEPVRVAGRLHTHRAPRAGPRHRPPQPAEPRHARPARRVRLGDVCPRGAAGGDRRDDGGREARRGARVAARGGGPAVVDPGAPERPEGDPGRGGRRTADGGLGVARDRDRAPERPEPARPAAAAAVPADYRGPRDGRRSRTSCGRRSATPARPATRRATRRPASGCPPTRSTACGASCRATPAGS